MIVLISVDELKISPLPGYQNGMEARSKVTRKYKEFPRQLANAINPRTPEAEVVEFL